jgi:uncharacterized protein YqeY
MTLKTRLNDDVKAALKSGDKPRVGTLRLILAGIKQREVDERIELDDDEIIVVLDKMAKQRRESMDLFGKAGRDDLVDQEALELKIIATYMPQPLAADEIEALIAKAISDTGAASIKDMGKVMALIRPAVQGRADMGALSAKIKALLG